MESRLPEALKKTAPLSSLRKMLFKDFARIQARGIAVYDTVKKIRWTESLIQLL